MGLLPLMTVDYGGAMEEQATLAYEVKLEAFTGPLDLLLHLIRKHEIDIYDIPIALITQQYLESLQAMKDLNLSLAGEFLVMAATLIHIKSRMLLPKEEEPETGEEEGDDPRSELVRRLVEYQQFKEAAGRLSDQEKLWRQMFQRDLEPVQPVREVFADDAVTLSDLLGALQDVLMRTEANAMLEITPDTITVQDRINGVIERLEDTPTLTFTALFDGATNRLMVIVTFLALLELVRMKLVRIYQADLFGVIRITRTFLAGQLEPDPDPSRDTNHDNPLTDGDPSGNGTP